MSMVKGYDLRRENDQRRFMRELRGTTARCSFGRSEPIDAESSDELDDQIVQEPSRHEDTRLGPARLRPIRVFRRLKPIRLRPIQRPIFGGQKILNDLGQFSQNLNPKP